MTKEELQERQRWPLHQKVDHTLGVIDQFISRMNGNVYLAYSGGKDSTVLMHLCEILKPDILCTFVNTGCEYPSIVKFVRKMKDEGHNIRIIRPNMRPKDVWAKYGFPLVSKKVSHQINLCRRDLQAGRPLPWYIDDPKSFYKIADKWRYLFHTAYNTDDHCCHVLKKEPQRRLAKELGLAPIIGVMASESNMREKDYIRQGQCNSFDEECPLKSKSLPLSIWTDDDVWQFVKERNIELADIYSKGIRRTGCVACGYGCQFADDTRLVLLYKLYPKLYAHIMNYENNGVTYRQALREMLKVEGMYLPDENPQLSLFDLFDQSDL